MTILRLVAVEEMFYCNTLGPSLSMGTTLNVVPCHEIAADHVFLVMAIIFLNKDGHFQQDNAVYYRTRPVSGWLEGQQSEFNYKRL